MFFWIEQRELCAEQLKKNGLRPGVTVNHNNLILISDSDSGETCKQAPYTVLQNKISKLVTTVSRHY